MYRSLSSPDKKRLPAAPGSSSGGGGAARPGHLRPTALRLCWAGYRWSPSTGLSRGRVWRREDGRGRPGGEAGEGEAEEGAQSGAHRGRRLRAGERGEAGAPVAAAPAARKEGSAASARAAASAQRHPKAPGVLSSFAAPPSAPQFSYPPSQSCLPLPRPPRARFSPAPRSSCCSCRRLASRLGAVPGSPKEPVRAAGWEGGAAQPVLLQLLLLLLPSPVTGRCAPQHPAGRASGHISRLQFGRSDSHEELCICLELRHTFKRHQLAF
ncbi:uncharacterized protein [Castor canadensis]|uniref:Uncharacterized protein n=1 Tax=Castor canadensis TaxID=51338 RepID=A0AC58K6Z9_CASCN